MYNATVVERQELASGLFILFVAPDAGVPDFLPGQFIRIGLTYETAAGRPLLLKRAYSIASGPQQKRAIELYLVRVEDGRLSPRLWQLREGDRLWVENHARGDFTLAEVPTSSHLLLIATGTGIAPYISMLRAYRGTHRWRTLTLVHGARYACDLAYCTELQAAAREPDIAYVPILSREPDPGWSGLKGRVQAVLEPPSSEVIFTEPLTPNTHHVFLCGNPEMVRELSVVFVARGFQLAKPRRPGNLHIERYW